MTNKATQSDHQEPYSGGLGGGVLPYMGYIGGMCCEGYGFQAVYSKSESLGLA